MRDSMRILIINWRDILHPQAGGAEVHVHETFRRIAERDHHVTLLCSRVLGQKREEMIDGIRTIRTGNWKNFNLAAASYYLRHLNRDPWDIIVDDINKIPFYTPLYARRSVLLLVPHLFGTTVFLEAPFHLAAYVYLWERLVPLVYRNTPAVAISASTKQDLLERGLSEKRISVVHCGIDHALYRPIAGKVPTPPYVFLYLGRLKRYKNVESLLVAGSMLKRHSGLRIAIAGEGDDLERLKRRTKELDMADRVTFHGYVSLEEKVRLLQTAHAMVVPSPKEGWGLTAIEASACGTPVIASKSPGLVDSVKHGRSGLHVPHGDSVALAEAMELLIKQPDYAQTLREGAVEWAAQFDWEKSAEQMLRELERAAQSRPDV
jgi:glycosyltransferase involved in cell wall biosynthesis